MSKLIQKMSVALLSGLVTGVVLVLLAGYVFAQTPYTPIPAVVLAVMATLVTVHLLLLRPLLADIHRLGQLVETEGEQNAVRDGWLAQLGQRVAGSELRLIGETMGQYHDCSVGVVGRSGRIAMAGAEVSHAADVMKQRIDHQLAELQTITEATDSISGNIEQAAANSENLKELSRQTRRASYIGQEAIGEASEQMRSTGSHAQEAARLIGGLEERAVQISQITKVISEIADQTNLLALNAAIEAARAGEQGRGFAVVAEEVRNLANRTSSATTEIGQMVQLINQETGNAGTTMRALVDEVEESRQRTEKVDTQLLEILEHAREVEKRVISAAERSEQNRQHQEQINGSMALFRESLEGSGREVESVADQAMELSEMAESIYELLGEAGLREEHAIAYREGRAAVEAIESCFEQAIAQGQLSREQLFDRNYRPIEGTDPVKFKTQFDDFTDAHLPQIQEPILQRHAFMLYAGAVDDRGYFPTHNKRYSKPLSGDYEKDLLNNRTKRIFDDRTGARCSANTKPFLLQTYKWDTGEVMHDLSIPIYIDGRHWGGFRIGYQSSD